jgi:hypothetical protein
MRSDVMGDFQEPYGAIFGEFDKLGALLLGYWFSLKIRRKRSPIIAQGCFNPGFRDKTDVTLKAFANAI